MDKVRNFGHLFNDLPMAYFYKDCYTSIKVKCLKYVKYHVQEMHNHDYPQVLYCLKGNLRMAIEETDIAFGEGDFAVIPSGVFHGFETIGDEVAEVIFIDMTYFFFESHIDNASCSAVCRMFLPQFREELGFALEPITQFRGKERTLAEKILTQIASVNYNRRFNIASVRRALTALFNLPSLSLTKTQRKKAMTVINTKLAPVMQAIKYINLNYRDKILSEKLLRVSALCRSDFFKAIKKVTGCTFTYYIQTVRLVHVRYMLTFSTLSFQYLADTCGFGSVSYMNRIFKRHYGVTLSHERAQYADIKKQFPNTLITRDYLTNFTAFNCKG